MTITKLPSGNYRVRYYDESGKQKSFTIDHEPGKKELQRLVDEKLSESKTHSSHNMTFSQAAEDYVKAKYNVLSPSTRKGYAVALKRLSDNFTSTNINNIDQIMVQHEINRLSAINSPKTVKNTHGFITAVLSMFRPMLILKTTLPQKEKKDFYLPTNDDIKRILDEVRDTKYYVPFVLGICGMRRSEICAALPEDIKDNYLYINKAKVQNEKNEFEIKSTKTTDSTRKILLSNDIIKIIQDAGEIYTGNDTSLWKALDRCQKKLNIPHFRFHDLRGYFASYAHEHGMSDQMIQEAGGWKTDATMKRVYRRTMQDEYASVQQRYWDDLKTLL